MAWRNLPDEIADEFLDAQTRQVDAVEKVYHKRRYRPANTWKIGRNGHAYPLHPSDRTVCCKNPECQRVIQNTGGHRGKSYCTSRCRNRAGYTRLKANSRRRSRAYAPAVAIALDNRGAPYVLPETGINLSIATDVFQMTLIAAALKRTAGNKAHAARLLSVNRTTLVEMINRLQRTGSKGRQ